MKSIVTFHEPKLRPLPPSVTPQIMAAAPLPARIEAAKRAVAECYDLSELLTWQDSAMALAAAAKAARMPELAKGANRVCKEALLRMGQLLLRYKGTMRPAPGTGGGRPSERQEAVRRHGIRSHVAIAATRFAKAPSEIINSVLDDDALPPVVNRITKRLPLQDPRHPAHNKQTDDANIVLSGRSWDSKRGSGGLLGALHSLRAIPLERISGLTDVEKVKAKKLVVDIQERCDEIEQWLSK